MNEIMQEQCYQCVRVSIERASEMHQGGGVCTTAITEEGFANSCACADVFFSLLAIYLMNHIFVLFNTDIYSKISV